MHAFQQKQREDALKRLSKFSQKGTATEFEENGALANIHRVLLAKALAASKLDTSSSNSWFATQPLKFSTLHSDPSMFPRRAAR